MRSHRLAKAPLFLVFTLCVRCVFADSNEEIVDRCMGEVAEFGAAMVQTCVEQDQAAAEALKRYPFSAKDAVARCSDQLKRRGWSVVKTCVDRDVEAGQMVTAYAKEHAATVEQCHQRWGEQGAVKVKECVEAQLNGAGKQ
jgi:hypothetical protein